MNDDYSQAGQDRFVSSLIRDDAQHYFLDVGCWVPRRLNNTLLLEEKGWNGISIDILDFKREWASRQTAFIMADALALDYEVLLNNNKFPSIIDYLNVDIEGEGLRFAALKKIFESSRKFKIITIEHDAYRDYYETERKPQRDFLNKAGYQLVCGDVCATGNPFEDWWINPEFFGYDEYQHLICEKQDYNKILNKLK